MHMTRYWMTGCMALILMVAGRWSQQDEQDEDREGGQRTRITLTSRYGAEETARQIERTMRRSGVPVLARTEVQPPPGDDDVAPAPTRVLVLGDEGRQTAIVQHADERAPDLPWSVRIQPRPDGLVEVWVNDPSALAPPEGVSPDMWDKLRNVPRLVQAAIT
jgi:uncharacterized protein (DUF302 family)